MPSKPKLSADTILGAEFEYIATTATQSNEDRSKVATFYFVSVGSLIAAIFSAQLFEVDQSGNIPQNIYLAFCALFGFLTILGYLTIAQLARLRTAWMDSIRAMNRIKTYYVNIIGPDLDSAFLWKDEVAPMGYKPGSVANYLAYQVAILSGLMFAASVFFLQQGIAQTKCLWPFTISLGLLMCFLQLYAYKKIVSKEYI